MKDPDTGIRPINEWGKECARGFVRDARFGSGQVIKGTNRNKTRQNRKVSERLNQNELFSRPAPPPKTE